VRNLSNINIKESIRRKRLVFKENFSYIINISFIILYFSLAFAMSIAFNYQWLTSDGLDIFTNLLLLPLISFLCLCIVWRKLSEKRLAQIQTNSKKEDTIRTLVEYARSRKYSLYMRSPQCLIFTMPSSMIDIFSFTQYKSFIILLDEDRILFTILTKGARLDLPVLFTHLIIRNDLKKLLCSGAQ
jgi:hypothetical protein